VFFNLKAVTLYTFIFLALTTHTFPLVLVPFQLCASKEKTLWKEHSALIIPIYYKQEN